MIQLILAIIGWELLKWTLFQIPEDQKKYCYKHGCWKLGHGFGGKLYYTCDKCEEDKNGDN